jgi:hypothetical protein
MDRTDVELISASAALLDRISSDSVFARSFDQSPVHAIQSLFPDLQLRSKAEVERALEASLQTMELVAKGAHKQGVPGENAPVQGIIESIVNFVHGLLVRAIDGPRPEAEPLPE